MQFRDLDISLFSDSELSGLLRRTAEDILRLVYFQSVSLTRVWNDLDRTEQFDVKVNTSLIGLIANQILLEARPQSMLSKHSSETPPSSITRDSAISRRLTYPISGRFLRTPSGGMGESQCGRTTAFLSSRRMRGW